MLRYSQHITYAMNILLLGSGGREHAMAWKLSQSSLCSKLLVAPGNAGTANCAINLPFSVTDFCAIENAIRHENISLLIVGPEEPLVKGLVDYLNDSNKTNPFQNSWIGIIGPSKKGAQLEGSKAFAKAFMERNGIPTAAYMEFTRDNYEEGKAYLKQHSLPIVLKADGLAAGKGVVICTSHNEALKEFEEMLQLSKFGEAGSKVVVEEFLTGIELSVFVLTDGKNYVLLPEAKDYKRIGEGDTGLNTGGMGAISPVPFANEIFMKKVIQQVVDPTINGLQKEGIPYTGFIFFGLIKVDEEPFVIEYNCRMGDPETEVVIPRIKNDMVKLLVAAAKGELANVTIDQDPRYATTIVAVSGGYPNKYEKKLEISGLENKMEDALIFHSGTLAKNGTVITNGGRVFCSTALAPTLEEALNKSNEQLKSVHFKNMYYRNDIGFEFINTTHE